MQAERRVNMEPQWEPPLLAAGIPLDDWRKSSQFSTLTRTHADLVSHEVPFNWRSAFQEAGVYFFGL